MDSQITPPNNIIDAMADIKNRHTEIINSAYKFTQYSNKEYDEKLGLFSALINDCDALLNSFQIISENETDNEYSLCIEINRIMTEVREKFDALFKEFESGCIQLINQSAEFKQFIDNIQTIKFLISDNVKFNELLPYKNFVKSICKKNIQTAILNKYLDELEEHLAELKNTSEQYNSKAQIANMKEMENYANNINRLIAANCGNKLDAFISLFAEDLEIAPKFEAIKNTLLRDITKKTDLYVLGDQIYYPAPTYEYNFVLATPTNGDPAQSVYGFKNLKIQQQYIADYCMRGRLCACDFKHTKMPFNHYIENNLGELLGKIKIYIPIIKKMRVAILERELCNYKCQFLQSIVMQELNYSDFGKFVLDLYKKRLAIYEKINHGENMVFLLPLPVNNYKELLSPIFVCYRKRFDIFKIRTEKEMSACMSPGLFRNYKRAIEMLNTGGEVCANYSFPGLKREMNTHETNTRETHTYEINKREKFITFSEINYEILALKSKRKYIEKFTNTELNWCVEINVLTVECIKSIFTNLINQISYE